MIEGALLALGFSEDSETYRFLVKSFYSSQSASEKEVTESVRVVKTAKDIKN